LFLGILEKFTNWFESIWTKFAKVIKEIRKQKKEKKEKIYKMARGTPSA
jgi:hypothetical protein